MATKFYNLIKPIWKKIESNVMNKMFKILSLSLLMSVQLVNASFLSLIYKLKITQHENNYIMWSNKNGVCIEKRKSNIDGVEENNIDDITIMEYPNPAYKAILHEGKIKCPHSNENGFTYHIREDTFNNLLKKYGVDPNTEYKKD